MKQKYMHVKMSWNIKSDKKSMAITLFTLKENRSFSIEDRLMLQFYKHEIANHYCNTSFGHNINAYNIYYYSVNLCQYKSVTETIKQ